MALSVSLGLGSCLRHYSTQEKNVKFTGSLTRDVLKQHPLDWAGRLQQPEHVMHHAGFAPLQALPCAGLRAQVLTWETSGQNLGVLRQYLDLLHVGVEKSAWEVVAQDLAAAGVKFHLG